MRFRYWLIHAQSICRVLFYFIYKYLSYGFFLEMKFTLADWWWVDHSTDQSPPMIAFWFKFLFLIKHQTALIALPFPACTFIYIKFIYIYNNIWWNFKSLQVSIGPLREASLRSTSMSEASTMPLLNTSSRKRRFKVWTNSFLVHPWYK